MTEHSYEEDPNEVAPAAPPPSPGVGRSDPGETGRSGPGTEPGREVGTGLPTYDPTAPAVPRNTEPAAEDRRVTRAGMVWAAVATALVLMVLLIVFILQNQDYVQVRFFGLEGAVSLGVALFIAAVGGGVLVALAGAARIIQLRAAAHRRRVLTERSG
ncbi:lipopolysaccharide assembly LapA domain-containing protein [Arthrobacter sp. ISL-72]|uniref:LapA family protein n=1 Tax=Arthrobacter sp. ISL-72 TaxID=2819114 RepID=UPI0020357E8D|nr:lipopolysaccharide assembly protein LapA domain-containing protein [Arthrobacter sp. ISL-72]